MAQVGSTDARTPFFRFSTSLSTEALLANFGRGTRRVMLCRHSDDTDGHSRLGECALRRGRSTQVREHRFRRFGRSDRMHETQSTCITWTTCRKLMDRYHNARANADPSTPCSLGSAIPHP